MSLNQSKYYNFTKDPQTGNLKILDESHYYPFGLRHEVYVTGSKRQHGFGNDGGGGDIDDVELINVLRTDYQYKYNGKELQDELGLSWYDYGARNYDPALGRWMNVDPLAEEYSNLSIYNYVNNNPIRFVDPTGMKGEDFINIKINTQKNEVSIERIQAKGDDEVRIIKDGEVTDSYKYGENGSFAEDAKIEKLYIGTTKMIGVVFNDFNNLEKAEKFYKFAAKSGVEFGHVSLVDFNTNEFQSIVMTSGAKRSVPYTNYAYKLMRNNPGLHMLEGSHSHPNGNYNENYGGPSGFDYNSLKPNNGRGDRRNFIDGKNEFKGRMPEYLNVYFPSSPNIDVKYNGNEAIRTKK